MTVLVPKQPMVFSIRKRYVDMFLIGIKQVEYRTRCPNVLHGEMVLIYETAPTSAIVATARMGDIVDCPPAEVWDRVGHIGGI